MAGVLCDERAIKQAHRITDGTNRIIDALGELIRAVIVERLQKCAQAVSDGCELTYDVQQTLISIPVILAVPLLPSCGNGTPAAPTMPIQAAITLAILPNPVTSVACNPLCVSSNGTSFPFTFSATLNIQETGGVGGNVDFINFFGQHGVRTYGTVNFGADVISRRAGTNHIAARATLSFPFTIDFTNGDGTHDLLGNINIQFSDDRGNKVTPILQFNVL